MTGGKSLVGHKPQGQWHKPVKNKIGKEAWETLFEAEKSGNALDGVLVGVSCLLVEMQALSFEL
jgi:hypothetical protein